MTRLHVKVVCILLLLSVGTGFVLGYNHIKLIKERTSLQQEVKGLNKKVVLLQRKYAEKKALTEQHLREKSAIAGQKRALEVEVERLGRENKSMFDENKALNALKKKLKNETLSLKAKIEKFSENYSKVKTELADLELKYGRVVMGFDQDLKRMAADKKTLESEVRKERHKFNRCETKNAKLCLIANELIEKYQNKGIVGTLIQKEPFTQLKKVEIEKFMQEYKEKIEEQELERKR
ncbi:MAG: hypothetical protein IME97_05065 [Proteobacteria bacterium]|nr:hypothetical protein [Pseudomonadota bacterium]